MGVSGRLLLFAQGGPSHDYPLREQMRGGGWRFEEGGLRKDPHLDQWLSAGRDHQQLVSLSLGRTWEQVRRSGQFRSNKLRILQAAPSNGRQGG